MMNLSANTTPQIHSSSKHMVSRSPLNTTGHLSPSFTSPSRNPLLTPLSPLSSDKNICKDVNCTATTRIPCSCDTCSSKDGMTEMLASLALMCVLSLLTAFLALFFMQKSSIFSDSDFINDDTHHITRTSTTTVDSSSHGVSQSRLPSYNRKEHLKVSQISLSLCTLTISLNLSCLFVCCIQFLSAAKLLKTPQGVKRATDFFKKTSHVRTAAIGAFLISIPIFFTGIILFNFVTFDHTPALATIVSLVIGLVIVFCGLACVQAVYLWQLEKTKATQQVNSIRLSQNTSVVPILELSTLV